MNQNLQFRLREKYNPDGSTLRKAQLRMVDMLIYFDKICRENKLEYWLSGGTLLGAVRHKGFIPWDDDIDVCMRRKDAEKLFQILDKKPQKTDFVPQTHKTDKFHYVFWNRIRDVKSANVSHSYVQDNLKYKGLAIDVFTMDDNIKDKLKKATITIYHHLILMPLNSNKPFYKKLRIFVPTSYLFIRKICLPIARMFSFFHKNEYMTYSYCLPWNQKIKNEIIFPLKKIEFENYSFFCPNNSAKYLEIIIGDWERIPAEEDIVTHDTKLELYF